jgi:hypothetical protein
MRLRATKLAAIGFGGARLPLPSLDLQFATDKTLTARRGPTPTFSRASGATEIGSDGLIRYAPENLLLRSQEFNLTWAANNSMTVTADAVIAPDGTLTADAINFDSNTTSRIIQFAGSAVVHTFSVWLRADTNKTVVIATQASGSLQVETICNVTTTWQRFSVVATNWSSGTASFNVRIANNAAGTSGTVYAWGAQLERHTSARTYIPTTSAAAYGPRFDHDPVTLACKGLLIEESRTNLLQYSEIFNEAASSNNWDSATANAVTSNQTTSPDGAATADLLTTSTTSFDCFVRRTINWVGSTQYSYSIFLKRGPSNYRYVGLYIGAGITGALQYPYFDFDNPTTVQIPSGTMVGTINSTRVDAYPNGWYRVSVTFTTAATPVTIYGGVYVSTSNGTLSSTPTAGLDCYIWGIQLELGSFPTSYIPTAAASVVRSADVCSITGSNFTGIYNGLEGTIISDGSIASIAGNNRGMWAINNNTSAHGFLTYYDAATPGISSQSRNTGSTALTPNFLNSANTLFKRALAYRTGQASICTNGSSVTATNVTISTQTMLTLQVGNMLAGSFYWSGHIAAIRYYKKRLPDAKLQSLTT